MLTTHCYWQAQVKGDEEAIVDQADPGDLGKLKKEIDSGEHEIVLVRTRWDGDELVEKQHSYIRGGVLSNYEEDPERQPLKRFQDELDHTLAS
jgi:hypothetical protein